MIRRLFCLFALATTAACNGAVVTAWPLFTDSTAVMEPRLLGDWMEEQNDTLKLAVTFSVDSGKRYRILLHDDSVRVDTLVAHLGRLGPHWVLDVEWGGGGNKADLQVHYPVVIQLTDSTFQYFTPETEPLKQPTRRLPFRQVVIFPSGDVLIGDPTPELVKGLGSYLGRADVLDTTADVLVRRRPTGPAPVRP